MQVLYMSLLLSLDIRSSRFSVRSDRILTFFHTALISVSREESFTMIPNIPFSRLLPVLSISLLRFTLIIFLSPRDKPTISPIIDSGFDMTFV